MADYINNNAGMDWDDAIENDGQEFIILPEGDYNFTVTDNSGKTYSGTAKAKLTEGDYVVATGLKLTQNE